MGVVIHDIYPSSPFLYTSSCPLIHYLPWLGGSKSLTHQSHTGIHYPSRFAQYACCHPTEPPSQSFPARDGPISQLELCLSPLQQKPLQTPSQIFFHGVYFKMGLSSTAANWYWVPVIYRSYYEMPRKLLDVCFNPPLGTLRWSWWYKKGTSDSYDGLQGPYICRHFFLTFTWDLFMQLEPAAHWLFLYLYSFCTLLVCKDFWVSVLLRGLCIHF